MKCKICESKIENYNKCFNHFIINEKSSADICNECIEKFMKWQGEIYSKLFPTSAMKKLYKK